MVAGLGDELQARQALEEGGVEARALSHPDQHGIVSELLQRTDLFREDVDRRSAPKTPDRGVGVEYAVIVVEDCDLLHATSRVPVSPRSARDRLGGSVMSPMR